MCFGENLQADGCPVNQWINRIHVATGGTDVADARGQPRGRFSANISAEAMKGNLGARRRSWSMT